MLFEEEKEEVNEDVLLFQRLMAYCNESLKYIIFGFFKRIKIMLKLLMLIAGKPTLVQKDSISSSEHCQTYCNLLIGSFWWFF